MIKAQRLFIHMIARFCKSTPDFFIFNLLLYNTNFQNALRHKLELFKILIYFFLGVASITELFGIMFITSYSSIQKSGRYVFMVNIQSFGKSVFGLSLISTTL